ncbi:MULTISPECIES: CobW family GTP-binding protein [unclassified Campylobacter]|uniref:CobW family GTP-binding protein n=1 Tax=unclassified Campylobacter TaxID=2593542 RepID=UPI0012383876|nr:MULTISPECIES: GTP-binding protein [unclassified Campylobacter]KAA6224818.1 GTP-binding protein [Campylobacter sp. LR185c]KAA6227393.1 GTP-binding protein [Campylobacter sp. LR196d]KAA6228770.1 GTP-binding protein [Campylobacter sp. LR286c]KAA6230824.1 GTP-binding protein [Campylobacter sp. LR291e]KAA8604861.1 cobalamin biosynthesis protein P47K [Campylobacter sp. LR185c]
MPKISTHIITGFLGSGKTTFLQELLKDKKNENIAVIVNELGEIALDDILIKSEFVREKTLLLNSGCMCCKRREDLALSLKNILDKMDLNNQKLQRVIIETTGLANPAPIIFTFLTDPFLSNHFELSNIITCVDALNGIEHIKNNEEALNQIIISDCILLTKCDLNPDINELSKVIKGLNSSIQLIKKAEFNFDDLINTKHQEINIEDTQKHSDDINSLCFYFENFIDWNLFSIWLSMLLNKYGDKILRVKGLLDIGENTLININGVGHLIYPPTHIKSEEKNSKLVFIAKNLSLDKIILSLESFLNLSKQEVKFRVVKF